MARGSETLRDVLDIKEDVLAGDFKIELSRGFSGSTAGSVEEYVVTEQLRKEFDTALRLVRSAVKKNTSHAAYLHGSFGAGKSHFLTVLHAVLNGEPSVRAKPRLREAVAEHDDWLPGKKFLMVPYHLVGAVNLDSALLDGYVKTVRALHPDAPVPPVHKADFLLADARAMRETLGDDAFVRLLPSAAPAAPRPVATDDDGDLSPIGSVPASAWTGELLDAAFAAPPGDQRRDNLVAALVNGPMKSYTSSAQGVAASFVSLDDGLSAISRHARDLGYDGVVLFLDELILWLQARMRERTFVNDEIQKLVKLIESANPDRPVPIISFISRQRDLSQLVGSDILGSDVKNMEQALEYLKERVSVVNLEDRNLPDIIKERVLKPRPGGEAVLDRAFAGVDKSGQLVKDVLLDGGGATQATWEDFRAVYPLSPALLNVLVALSGALQRERTGLKLVQQLLEKNADAAVGQLIPLGDLWDVLVDGTGAAFTDKLRHEAESARLFHSRARNHLLEKYGSADHPDFLADDRFVKTLLLAALAPDVPALRRLTAGRLAALNHGSVRSRTVPVKDKVIDRMRALQGEFSTELRSEGEGDPVFSLHLSDLDVEPLLDAAAGEDKAGVRRVWLRDRLWEVLGVKDGRILAEKEIIWRGTRRTAEFVFGNVRDPRDVPDEQFAPATEGNIRFVVDYPFDEDTFFPSYDYQRVKDLIKAGHEAPTLVWLPDFFSEQRKAQLGRLMRILFLLERDRLAEYTRNYPPDDRAKARRQLEVGRETLTRTLTGALAEVYGIATVKDGTRGAEVPDGEHVLSLEPKFRHPQPEGGKTFGDNVRHLAAGLFAALHPQHPDFGNDPRTGQPKAVTPGEIKTTLEWITRAMDEGGRVEVDDHQLRTVKRIAEPLELGAVHDGPLVLRGDWRTRINQAAGRDQETRDTSVLPVEDIRRWIVKDLGYSGLEKQTTNLIIATYALLDDRAWVYHSGPAQAAPALAEIGPGWALRSQPLPSDDEYAQARDRAGHLFGIASKPAKYARTVNKLAAGVREKAEVYEKAVGGVRASLDRHADLLGLGDAQPHPRTGLLREANSLLARIGLHGKDATGLVRELAGASYDCTDRDLSTTMSTAVEVLAALDSTDWRLLGSVRDLSGRDDSVGDRARRLLAQIGEAARASEFERSLVPALASVRETAMAIVDAALKVERAPAPANPAPPSSGAGQVSLGEGGSPSVPSTHPVRPADADFSPASGGGAVAETQADSVRAQAARRLLSPGPTALEASLAQELAAVRQEIEEFRSAHPEVTVEIVWRAVHDVEDTSKDCD
ncbi:hypothetical protein ACFV0Z_07115 [Streptomyces xiamenensis]|uniref:hypothetical protein n=1 Tax=Streptomyces xiamenensis TaxID=408015 RepID=UPI0036B96D42